MNYKTTENFWLLNCGQSVCVITSLEEMAKFEINTLMSLSACTG